MTKKVDKSPLDFESYAKYEIPHEYMAFTIQFFDVSQMECDDLEYDYYRQGFKIFHTEIERSSGGLFNYKMIIAKSAMTFQK
ncbi:MAG: hypothetical protein CME62_05875 [Halobacteriovoraceae bacterium]|nr:hypothetical protein [Halobacteriovoraceae bacterium]